MLIDKKIGGLIYDSVEDYLYYVLTQQTKRYIKKHTVTPTVVFMYDVQSITKVYSDEQLRAITRIIYKTGKENIIYETLSKSDLTYGLLFTCLRVCELLNELYWNDGENNKVAILIANVKIALKNKTEYYWMRGYLTDSKEIIGLAGIYLIGLLQTIPL